MRIAKSTRCRLATSVKAVIGHVSFPLLVSAKWESGRDDGDYVIFRLCGWVVKYQPLKGLSCVTGKLSRTVFRGAKGREALSYLVPCPKLRLNSSVQQTAKNLYQKIATVNCAQYKMWLLLYQQFF